MVTATTDPAVQATSPNSCQSQFHDDPNLDLDWLAHRAMHYADRPGDKACLCDFPSRSEPGRLRKLVVLFRPVPEVPLWVLPVDSPQAAVNARIQDIAHGGFEVAYGNDDLRYERDPERMKAQAKMNLAEMSSNRSLRDNARMREILDENLAASRNQTPEIFAERRRKVLEQNAELGFGKRKFDFGGAIGVREVPLAPLLYWSLKPWSASSKALPDWKPISPQGVKMMGDAPVHSDWITGAGLENFIDDLSEKQMELMAEIQEEYLGLKVNVLVAGRREATGKIVYATSDTPCEPDEIAIIPDAGPRYYEAARTAAAVVALKGGSMSHLAQIGLEEGFLIVRVPDAKSRYPEGAVIHVDANVGKITLIGFDDEDRPSGDSFRP